MNTTFKRQLADVTRLTRAGDLDAATRAIREALGGASTGPSFSREPVDGRPARADRSRSRRNRVDRSAATTRGGGVVIDGEWHALDESGSNGTSESADTSGAAASASAGAAAGSAEREGTDGAVTRARHAGRSRTLDYRLFVPPLSPDTPPPALVVMLHGCTQDAEDFAVGTGMDRLAREHGFLVLYPEQSGRANPQRCWNWFKDTHQRRGQGEPALIEGAIRDVVAAHGVDADRVFVAGLSAGGAMAAILGDVCPDLIRAVGVHSGLAAGVARDMPGALAAMRGGQGVGAPGRVTGVAADVSSGDAGRRPPTIVFHGDADRTVHPDNGERVVAASVGAARRASGAASTLERRRGHDSGRDWTRDVHVGAAGDAVAEHWRVHGAAHAWSGGDARGSWTDARGPDASAEMVRFFLAAGARRR